MRPYAELAGARAITLAIASSVLVLASLLPVTDAPAADLVPLFQGALRYEPSPGDKPFPAWPCQVATADFNGDGRLDVALVSHRGLSVQFGNGDGTLKPGATYQVSAAGSTFFGAVGDQCMAVGDVDGDGKPDVVALSDGTAALFSADRGLVVWINTGNGTFRAPVIYPIPALGNGAITLADVNGDGRPDVVLAMDRDAAPGVSSVVSVLLNRGDGTFAPFVNSPVGGQPGSIAVGDLNGDGKPDVVVGSFGDNVVRVLLGNGDGTFQAETGYTVSTDETWPVLLADLDGDGKADIVVGVPGTNFGQRSGTYSLRGNGNGTFQAAQLLVDLTWSDSIVATDLNGDGKTDLVFGNPSSARSVVASQVFIGNGNGTFQSPQYVYVNETGSGPIAIGDFNGDHRPDLVQAGRDTYQPPSITPNPGVDSRPGVAVMLQPFASTYGLNLVDPRNNAQRMPQSLAVGDFTGDGRIDIVSVQGDADVFLANRGAGQFNVTVNPQLGTASFIDNGKYVSVADFNGDGKLDYVASADLSRQTYIGFGNGDGTFRRSLLFQSSGGGPVAVDVNGDGKPDIIEYSQRQGAPVIEVLLNGGDGTFPFPDAGYYSVPLIDNGLGYFVVADFNGDGKPDVLVTPDNFRKTAGLLLGNGDGTFQAPRSSPPFPAGPKLAGALQFMAAGDFNGDGKQDAAVLLDVIDSNGLHASQVALMLGNGDGTFKAPVLLPELPNREVFSLRAIDVDGDGKLDLLVGGATSTGNGLLFLLRGNGDGTFRLTETYTYDVVGFVAFGDFTGSGKPSLALTNDLDRDITVMLNRSPVPASPAPTVTLGINPARVAQGASATLTWTSTNASGCTAGGDWAGSKGASGNQAVTPAVSGTLAYRLTCTGAGGTATASATLTVTPTGAPAPTVTLAVSPQNLTLGQSATLTWSSTNAATCTAAGGWTGTRATSGSTSVTPAETGSASYTLECTGTGGTASAHATVLVAAQGTVQPTLTLGVSPTSIALGSSATVSWSTTDSTACTASGGLNGAEPVSGSQRVTPAATGTVTYAFSCSGAGGTVTHAVTLTVTPATVVSQIFGHVNGGGGGFGAVDFLALGGLTVLGLARRRRRLFAAMALTTAIAPLAGAAEPGSWYAGLRVEEGRYQPSLPTVAGLTDTGIDRNQTIGGLYLGAGIGGPLSIEVGYVELGTYDVYGRTRAAQPGAVAQTLVTELRPSGHGGTLQLALDVPLGERFALSPRAGLLVSESRQEAWLGGVRYQHSRSNTGFAGGLTLRYRAAPALSVGLSADCFGPTGLRCDVVGYGLDLRYHFGAGRSGAAR